MMTLAVRKQLLCGVFILHIIAGWTELCGHVDHIPEVPHKIFKSCTQSMISDVPLVTGYHTVVLVDRVMPGSFVSWIRLSVFDVTQVIRKAMSMIRRLFDVDPPEL